MESNESFAQVEEKAAPERIGFGRRLGAYLLDFAVAGVVGGASSRKGRDRRDR